MLVFFIDLVIFKIIWLLAVGEFAFFSDGGREHVHNGDYTSCSCRVRTGGY
jgi:hypothetical protein